MQAFQRPTKETVKAVCWIRQTYNSQHNEWWEIKCFPPENENKARMSPSTAPFLHRTGRTTAEVQGLRIKPWNSLFADDMTAHAEHPEELTETLLEQICQWWYNLVYFTYTNMRVSIFNVLDTFIEESEIITQSLDFWKLSFHLDSLENV